MNIDDHWITTSRGRLFARSWLLPGHSIDRDTTVVLLHDSLGCVDLWRDFPERLAGALDLPVVAYDRLGFGRSDPHPGRLQQDFIRDETASGIQPLREAMGIRGMIPVGHSIGGAMAVGVAARLPAACAAVVTLSAQAFVEDRTLAGIRDAKVAFQDAEQFARLARYHGEKTRWVLDAWIETWLSPRFADWTLDEDLGQVRCPVLAIHGDRDEYGSAAHPERITSLVRAPSRMALLEGCGHVPQREKADETTGEIGRFLAPPVFSTAEIV